MCCGNKTTHSATPVPAATPSASWVVKDAGGKEVAVKTSQVAAKLHAARIGGSVEERSS